MSSAPVAQALQVLCAAASGDANVRVPAHRQLQELESRPGFAGLLLEAYSDASAEPQGRLLAILMCKNVVDRQWQPRSGQGLSAQEKTFTKECLLRLLKAAVQGQLPHLVELTMVVRKVCRFDFPRQWDELAHFVLGELQRVHEQGFDETTLAVVLVLHHVLKEQATKKLISARREMHQIGQVLTEPLGRVWCALLEKMRQEQGPGDERMWKLSRYLDGCFLILLTQGFAHLHESPNGSQMILMVKGKVSLLLGLLRTQGQIMVRYPFFLKNVKSVLKWWALLLHAHPLAFAQANVAEVLHTCVEVLQTYAAPPGDPQLRQVVESFLKSSLQSIAHGFNTVAFRKGPQPAHQGVWLEAATLCHAQFAEFLQRHSVDSLCDLCCGAALRLSAEDVQEWLADPEDQLQGPSTQTELHVAGENCVRALGQQPLERPVIEYIARRMAQEQAQPPTPDDPFEVVARRDTLLTLLSLCQPLLRPHLQFQQLLAFFAPVAALAVQGGKQAFCVLLPVRLCAAIRSWTADIPADAVMPVLQLLRGFLQEACPKAVRLAALGPLRSLLDRFSDHEAWAEAQGPLIDGCLALLGSLKSPEVQWRCLNLIHLFLCEEAESGRYEVTERALMQLLLLWRQPDAGELLICHALLDVLQALVLMSCHSKQPRLPLSQPLLSCCLAVVSDCYASHRGSSNGCGSPTNAENVDAALEAEAIAAAGRLGDGALASAKLFESGSVLFLAVLRTVDVSQAGQLLSLFPQLMSLYGEQSAASLHEGAVDLLLELCALCCALGAPGVAQLRPHCGPLALLCQRCLQGEQKGRHHERSLEVLQLLLAHSEASDAARLREEVVVPLFRAWSTTFDPRAGPGASKYPLQPTLQLFCTWHARHELDFRQTAPALGLGGAGHVGALLVAACKLARPVALRAAALTAALPLLDVSASAEGGPWQEFFKCCDELIGATQKKGNSAIAQTLQNLKSALTTKLPVPARSTSELQCCMLPPELRASLRDDGGADEVAVVRWFFDRSAQVLRQLTGQGTPQLQALLSVAPPQVQSAFRASGL